MEPPTLVRTPANLEPIEMKNDLSDLLYKLTHLDWDVNPVGEVVTLDKAEHIEFDTVVAKFPIELWSYFRDSPDEIRIASSAQLFKLLRTSNLGTRKYPFTPTQLLQLYDMLIQSGGRVVVEEVDTDLSFDNVNPDDIVELFPQELLRYVILGDEDMLIPLDVVPEFLAYASYFFPRAEPTEGSAIYKLASYLDEQLHTRVRIKFAPELQDSYIELPTKRLPNALRQELQLETKVEGEITRILNPIQVYFDLWEREHV